MRSHYINKTVNQREDKKISQLSYLHHPLEVEENLEPVGARDAEVDLPVDKVEVSISVLERTIKQTERTRGPALDTALQRQLAVRRDQLYVLHSKARSNSDSRVSVIVHTSTPDTSFSLHDFYFDGGSEIENPEDGSNQPPVEITFKYSWTLKWKIFDLLLRPDLDSRHCRDFH